MIIKINFLHRNFQNLTRINRIGFKLIEFLYFRIPYSAPKIFLCNIPQRVVFQNSMLCINSFNFIRKAVKAHRLHYFWVFSVAIIHINISVYFVHFTLVTVLPDTEFMPEICFSHACMSNPDCITCKKSDVKFASRKAL